MMLVRFRNYKDKYKLLEGRERIRSLGIRIANDLTYTQRQELRKLKNQGIFAYYKNGKLYKQPHNTPSSDYQSSRTFVRASRRVKFDESSMDFPSLNNDQPHTRKKEIGQNHSVNDISILTWNVGGLKGRNALLLEYVINYDIIGLIESWVTDISDYDNLLDGYKCFYCQAKKSVHGGKNMGGVIVYVRDHLVNYVKPLILNLTMG
jgi:hypothetical protein